MTCSDWQEMDSKAVQIADYQLKKLGLHVSPGDLLFHRNIGRGKSYVSASVDELCRGEEWLLRLENANTESRYFRHRGVHGGSVAYLVPPVHACGPARI